MEVRLHVVTIIQLQDQLEQNFSGRWFGLSPGVILVLVQGAGNGASQTLFVNRATLPSDLEIL
jgi:hypothetical protein